MQQLQLQQQPSSSATAAAALVESHQHVNGAEGSCARLGPDSNSSSSGGEGGADAPDQLELHVEAVVSTLSRVTDSVADVLKSLHLVTAQLDVIANKLCLQCGAASFDGGDAASTVCSAGGVRRGWRPATSTRNSLAEAGGCSGGGATRWRLPSCAASESGGGVNGGCCSGDEGESGYGGEGDAPRLSYPSESHSDDCGGGGCGGYGDDDKLSDSVGAAVASPVSSPHCPGRSDTQASAGGEPQPRSVSAQGLDEPHELDWDVNGLELSSLSPSTHDGYGRGGIGPEGAVFGDRPRTDAADIAAATPVTPAGAAYRDVPQQRLSHSFTSPAFSSSYGSLSDSGCCGSGGDRGGSGGGAYEFKVLLLQSLSEHDGWCRGDVGHALRGSSCRRRQPLPIAAPLYGSAYETQMESALESTGLRSDTSSTEDDYDYDDDICRGAVNDDSTVVDDNEEDENSYSCVAGGAESAARGSYGARRERSSPLLAPVTFCMGSAASIAEDNDARGSSAEVESTCSTTAAAFGDVQPVGCSLDAGGARWASYDRDVNTWQSFTLSHRDDTSDGRATPGGAGSSAASTPRPPRSAFAATAGASQPSPAATAPLSPRPTSETPVPSAMLSATEIACPANGGKQSKELPAKLSSVAGRLRERRRVRMSERHPVFV